MLLMHLRPLWVWFNSTVVLSGEPAMRLNGEYTWDLGQPATLVDMDVIIRSGAFVAIVGPTGGVCQHDHVDGWKFEPTSKLHCHGSVSLFSARGFRHVQRVRVAMPKALSCR